ncbi:hypothetical protein FVE85_9516 [Porphyridium purpureum]|uniref:Uncharacterized protein n=1 Tax=Porphyridium purpureum TaxID=35688 RepID=A0A5J4YIE8_PORPP|nr:hypothetical protein FVE85_9516 [Porphyridium purpureum]|eukprot:POR1704..scf261_15
MFCGREGRVANTSKHKATYFDDTATKRLSRISYFVNRQGRKLLYLPLDASRLHLRVYANASCGTHQDGGSQLGIAIFLGDHTDRAYDHTQAIQAELHAFQIHAKLVLYTDSKHIFDARTYGTTLFEKCMMVRLMSLREGAKGLSITELLRTSGNRNTADTQTEYKLTRRPWTFVQAKGRLFDTCEERLY